MAFRFVHTADIHLDSPLRTLALRDPELAELVGDATRQALAAIVDICLNERVDALVVAGDLFDGDQTSMKTARFLAAQMVRLHEAGIRVFKIRGNHDNLSRISKQLVFPDNVTVFGGRAGTALHHADGLDIAFHGLSFASAKAPESLVPKYPAPREGAVNIGIMHTSLGGAAGHDVYAPCNIVDLHGHGFSYWALGHIHVRNVHSGQSTIVMPGTPQGRDIGEDGPKSVTLVTVRDDGLIELEERLTAIAQFERVRMDISNASDWSELIYAIRSSIEALRPTVSARHAVVRLKLTGSTRLSWSMIRDRDLLLAEAQQMGAQTGSVWIEKIELDVQPSDTIVESSADPTLELAALMRMEAKSEAFRGNARESMLKLMSDLPPEVRNAMAADETQMESLLGTLLEEATDLVAARLKSEASE